MYTHILVGIDPHHEDGNEAALHMAMHLAENANSRITAMSVVEPVSADYAEQLPKDATRIAGQTAMDRLRKTVGPTFEVATEIANGRAADELNAFAAENGVDCIVIASHKPGLRDYFLGSTAARVVRHAPCSVHVMR